MEYVIEVNLARVGAPPVWHVMTDERGGDIVFPYRREAEDALAEEGRGSSARLARLA